MAQKTWELENNIESVPSVDNIFRYNGQQQQEILSAKPWSKEYVCVIVVYV
jgi:COP9 signalosome complex subunit 5